MSWGCCSYLNSVFVNESSNVLVISHIGYKHEYDEVMKYPCGFYNAGWFPEKCNKKMFLGDLLHNLNEETIDTLNDKITELLYIDN